MYIGAEVAVYEVAQVERALSTAGEKESAVLRRVLAQMLQKGGQRYVSKPTSLNCLEPLKMTCPHFSSVIDDLRKYLALAQFGRGAMNFAPILLAGDPGVGKTFFAKQLARALGVPREFASMSALTAGWILSGASPTWQGARHGKIAATLIESLYANPLFVLDEIDKMGGDHRFDPAGTMLELLEPETSSHFHDEFLDLEVNASQIQWIATANDLSRLSAPLLSRMVVYEVPAPSPEQAMSIAAQVYSALCKEHGWEFEPQLSQDVLEKLSHTSPRDMRLALVTAMGSARVGARDRITCDDINVKAIKTRAGFLGG